jgi:Copper type II ascorbate-dependent monooxygenase, C-terminal domain
MPEPYTPAAPHGGTDEYRCFLIDPALTRTAFLTGSQFLPQNSDIVHHAIFFRIDPADADAAHTLDASTPGQGWTCFGNAGVGRGAGWVAAWAPGANETLLDPGLGYSMPPGSQLVMQVHYNLLATKGKPGGTDQSGIRLRLTDDVAKMTPLQTLLVAAPVELPCAAGESGPLCDRSAAVADVVHRFGNDAGETVTQLNALCNKGNPPVPGTTQHCDRKLPQGGTIYALAGHMHLLGRSIKVELNPDTPAARTLLDIPVYNFDDQAARPLAKAVTVKPGDTLRVTCTHDASLRKRLPELQPLAPRYVVWGDGTSDEMCLGLVIMARG